ncbi:MAG: cystathionine gamma-synthase family protein [Propionibacteriaceae bacterium]|nr:cystathionine gamma-synthase family protein [Propionibacteriaceae bacterium]
MNQDQAHIGTKAVWAGEKNHRAFNASQVPVVVSCAYTYDDIDQWYDVALEKQPGHIYGRNTNPTVEAFEQKCAELEGAEQATSFATGMAAISNIFYTFLRPGDRVVSIKDSYGGTNKMFTEFLPNIDVECVTCETEDYDEIEAEIAKGCKLLYLESPTNPTVKILDIERLARAAKAVGALVVVDNTLATPINQAPLTLGADLVLHSATKFLGGHADALGGVVCGSSELVKQVYHYREITGATLQPWDAYLLLRGMKTLELRVTRQQTSAMQIATYLQGCDLIEAVNYPGLPTHRHHDVAVKQMKGFGGVLSFALKGGMDAVRIMLPQLQYANRAANLGAVETTYGPARTTSHVECTAEERAALGIPDGLVRLSVGIEDVDDLIADLDQALAYLRAKL